MQYTAIPRDEHSTARKANHQHSQKMPCNLARSTALRLRETALKARLRGVNARALHNAAAHDLPCKLVVSLTSYPGRFAVLPWTLRSLIKQTVRPDHLVLWIARDHLPLLTHEVRALQDYGIEIRQCEDLLSYKKIVPALEQFPDAFIITADDDLHYPPWWLRDLVRGYRANSVAPVAHRVHRIALTPGGRPKAYLEWTHCIRQVGAHPLNFATSGGGTLYPPNAFHEDVTRRGTFMRLCPTADDVWLYWMMRLKGNSAFNLGGNFKVRPWLAVRGDVALRDGNVFDGGNDRQIEAMYREYGLPEAGGHCE